MSAGEPGTPDVTVNLTDQPGATQAGAASVALARVAVTDDDGGYRFDNVPDLVEGTLKQQRHLATAPREVTEDDAAAILRDSLELW